MAAKIRLMQARLIYGSAELVEGGKGIRFEMDRDGEKLPAFAVRHEGCVHAYLNRCAHIGVELDWMPGEFRDDSGLYLRSAPHTGRYTFRRTDFAWPARAAAQVSLRSLFMKRTAASI